MDPVCIRELESSLLKILCSLAGIKRYVRTEDLGHRYPESEECLAIGNLALEHSSGTRSKVAMSIRHQADGRFEVSSATEAP